MSTKLYLVWGGKLETVTLLDDHYLCDGAISETYLIKDRDGRKASCSKDMYLKSPIEAWQHYADDLEDGIEAQNKVIAEAAQWQLDLIKQLSIVRVEHLGYKK